MKVQIRTTGSVCLPVLATCLSVILLVSPAAGQCGNALFSGGISGDLFGFEVEASDDVIVVSARDDAQLGENAGAAYIYRRTLGGWVMEAMLLASDGAAGDGFGVSIAIDGDLVAIGAFKNDEVAVDAGAVYVYRFDGVNWNEEAKLVATDAAMFDWFGGYVAIQGETIVVGATNADGMSIDSGAVYLFSYNGVEWIQQDKLFASDGAPADLFGNVAINGSTVVVGALWDDDIGLNSGSVYVYQHDGINWTEQAKLLPSAGVEQQAFGNSLAIDAGSVVVGAPGINTAYIFSFDGVAWNEQAALFDPEDGSGLRVGYSVDLRGGLAAIGTKWGKRLDFYREEAGAWSLTQRLPLDPYSVLPIFTSVAIADEFVVAGHIIDAAVAVLATVGVSDCNRNGLNDVCEINTGLAFDCNFNGIPDECETDCNNNGIPDDCDIADGASIDCNADGIPDECETDCNFNGIHDDCDVADGTSIDCNDDGIPDECEADCNGNEINDDCDIDASTSPDCNRNGVPDECDVSGATSFDCDANGVPDECEIDCNENGIGDACDLASGASLDLNGNGLPDECERANCPAEFKVIASDGNPLDWFGESVAIDGDVAVIGAYLDDENGEDAGAAYIFRRSGNDWLQEAKLLASDGAANNRYGLSVAIGNDVTIIGAPLVGVPGNASGQVYIYRDNPISGEWDEEAILQPSLPIPDGNTWFGTYMALENDVLAVSSGWLTESGETVIVANVYRYDPLTSNWVEEAILPISRIPYPYQWIPANAMSMSNGVIVGGEPGSISTPDGINPGTAFVYRYDPATSIWVPEGTLNASDPGPQDFFGLATAIYNDVIVVGALYHDDLGERSGSAYVYRYDSIDGVWVEEAKLLAPDGQASDSFGESVGIENDIILVGALIADSGVTNSGGVYRFRFDPKTTTWIPLGMIHARFPSTGDGFGRDLAISNGSAVISAFHDDNIVPDSGAAYFYEDIRQFCPAPGDINADGRINVFDLLAILSAWGDCLPPPPPANPCPEDLNHDGMINVSDLLILLANWG